MKIKLNLLAVVLAVLLLYVHAQNANAEVTCKKREEYTECGIRCEEACEQARDLQCSTICEAGCFCVKGTSRNGFGNCVPNHVCKYGNYIG